MSLAEGMKAKVPVLDHPSVYPKMKISFWKTMNPGAIRGAIQTRVEIHAI
jgi:hypothetical protein